MKIHNYSTQSNLMYALDYLYKLCKIATLYKHHGGIQNTRAEVIMQIPLICQHLFIHYSHNHSHHFVYPTALLEYPTYLV